MAAYNINDTNFLLNYWSRQKYVVCQYPTQINFSQSLLQKIVDGLQLSNTIPNIVQKIQDNLSLLLSELSSSKNIDDQILAGRLLTSHNQRQLPDNILSDYINLKNYLDQKDLSFLNEKVKALLQSQDWWNSQLMNRLSIFLVDKIYPTLLRQPGSIYPYETIELLFLRITAALTYDLPDISPQIYYYLQNGVFELPASLLISLGTNLPAIYDTINFVVRIDALQTFENQANIFRSPTNINLWFNNIRMLNTNLVQGFNYILPSITNLYILNVPIADVSCSSVIYSGIYSPADIPLLVEKNIHTIRYEDKDLSTSQKIIFDAHRIYSISIENSFDVIRQIARALKFTDTQSVRIIQIINLEPEHLAEIVFNLWLGNIESAISHGSQSLSAIKFPILSEYEESGSWGQFKIVLDLTREQIFGWADLQKLYEKYGLSYPIIITSEYHISAIEDFKIVRQLGRYIKLHLVILKNEDIILALSQIWLDDYILSVRFVN